MKNFFSKLPNTLLSNSGKRMINPVKRSFATTVGANGRTLPLPDDKPLKEFDPEMADLLLKE